MTLGTSPPPKADPKATCHPSERTAFGANRAARLLEARTSLAHPIKLSPLGFTDASNRVPFFFGSSNHSAFVRPQRHQPLPQLLQPSTNQNPVEIIFLRRNPADPRSEYSLWYSVRKAHFNCHNFDNGNPVYDHFFDPRETPPLRWQPDRAELLEFCNSLRAEDRDYQYSEEDIAWNRQNPTGLSSTRLDYRILTFVSVDVHHTIDLLNRKITDPRKKKKWQGPGYIPDAAFPLAQHLQNAGFHIFLNVSNQEGNGVTARKCEGKTRCEHVLRKKLPFYVRSLPPPRCAVPRASTGPMHGSNLETSCLYRVRSSSSH